MNLSNISISAYTSPMGWLFRLSNVDWIVKFGIQSGAYIASKIFLTINDLLASPQLLGVPEFDTNMFLKQNSGDIKLFPNEAIYNITITFDNKTTQTLNKIFITTTGWDPLSAGLSIDNPISEIKASRDPKQPLNLLTSDGFTLVTSGGFRLMAMLKD